MVSKSTKIDTNWSWKAFFLSPSFLHRFFIDFSSIFVVFFKARTLVLMHRRSGFGMLTKMRCFGIFAGFLSNSNRILVPFLMPKGSKMSFGSLSKKHSKLDTYFFDFFEFLVPLGKPILVKNERGASTHTILETNLEQEWPQGLPRTSQDPLRTFQDPILDAF
jgi:hypothetical protein